MLENFLLGVQGGGYVDFGDGNLNYFAYAGTKWLPLHGYRAFIIR